MEKTELIYEQLEADVRKKTELLREIANARLSSLKRDGWKPREDFQHLKEKKYGLKFWVQEVVEEGNSLKLKLLCVGGDERLRGLIFSKQIPKSNKHLLKSKFKTDEVFDTYLVRLDAREKHFDEIGFAGVTLFKAPKELRIKRMLVENWRNR